VPSLPSPFAPAIAAPCIQNPDGVFSAVQTGSGAIPHSSTAKWKDMQTMATKYGFQVE
jgi:hypothetical protein